MLTRPAIIVLCTTNFIGAVEYFSCIVLHSRQVSSLLIRLGILQGVLLWHFISQNQPKLLIALKARVAYNRP